MARGRVKWFNDAKGYGFIERAGDFYRPIEMNPSRNPTPEEEIFVHYTAIVGQGHRTLLEGQEVEFDIYEGPKGKTAQNVMPKA